MEIKGIDVSYFQGNINWRQVQNNQIEFAMIRATYGTTGTDKKFIDNINEIQKTNIYPGSYHYCYALNTNEAIEEAKHFINTIKPYKLYYPAALDMEERSIAELGKESVTDIIIAFIDTLRSEKYYPILYTDLNWIQNYINTNRINDLDIWIADWSPELAYKKNVTMWQYSRNGSIPGINGNVDMNISYKDYPSIIKEHGLNGTDGDDNSSDPPIPDPNPDPDPNPIIPLFYRVKAGDSLWNIAQRFLGNGDKFREIMAVNNLTSEVIKPGQLLRIPQNDQNNIVLYRVRRGNTLWNISQRFLGNGERYKEIMEINGLTTDTIYPGQILRVPVEPQNVTITYTVKNGDTLWNIAQRFLGNGERYRDIISLNDLSSEIIYPGQKLKIPSR